MQIPISDLIDAGTATLAIVIVGLIVLAIIKMLQPIIQGFLEAAESLSKTQEIQRKALELITDRLQRALDAEERQNDKLRAELLEQARRIAQLEGEAGANKKLIEELSSQIKKLTDAATLSKETVHSLEKRVTDLTAENIHLAQELKEVKEERDERGKEIEELKKQLAGVKASIAKSVDGGKKEEPTAEKKAEK